MSYGVAYSCWIPGCDWVTYSKGRNITRRYNEDGDTVEQTVYPEIGAEVEGHMRIKHGRVQESQ